VTGLTRWVTKITRKRGWWLIIIFRRRVYFRAPLSCSLSGGGYATEKKYRFQLKVRSCPTLQHTSYIILIANLRWRLSVSQVRAQDNPIRYQITTTLLGTPGNCCRRTFNILVMLSAPPLIYESLTGLNLFTELWLVSWKIIISWGHSWRLYLTTPSLDCLSSSIEPRRLSWWEPKLCPYGLAVAPQVAVSPLDFRPSRWPLPMSPARILLSKRTNNFWQL